MVQRYKCVLSETYFKINELKRLAWSTISYNLEYIDNLKRNIKKRKRRKMNSHFLQILSTPDY